MTEGLHLVEQRSALLAPARSAASKNLGVRGMQFGSTFFIGLLALATALPVIFVGAGCGASTKASSQSETPVISLAITQAPPISMATGGTAQVAATVNNDLAGAGVDWVATCASVPNCGSFNPPHTSN